MLMQPSLQRPIRGLTLVELMVVLTIIAISASLAAPGIAGMTASYRVRSAAESMLAGLSHARTEAVRRNGAVRFTLTGGVGWSVVQVSSGAVLQARSASAAGVTATPDASALSVTFLPTGLMESGAQLRQVTLASAGGEGGRRQIHIFGGGMIRMCDPDVASPGDPRRC